MGGCNVACGGGKHGEMPIIYCHVLRWMQEMQCMESITQSIQNNPYTQVQEHCLPCNN